MNGIFPADLAVYLLLTPVVIYIFLCHRWTGFLPWYYLTVFCFARIIGGGLGIHNSNGLPANIIQSVGLTPLILAIDGLIHEARTYRNPSQGRVVGLCVVIGTTGIMAAALALTIMGSLDIFEGNPKPDSLTHWKAGVALIVATWVFQIFWALFSLLHFQGKKDAPGYRGGTTLLQGALIALAFIGIRVIYSMIMVVTQDKDLSPIHGTIAVRVVLLFLPEVLAAITMIFVGLRTRHIRQN
ncbi:integral membrane protein [Penicillium riverlandense]|uniref:uncharacterized protein n=1 Tax=Penicillium riverlandense TaxID=1903569 RepID=UPI002548A769|nr:uncharacterized protein N7474_007608 [Penicillium riverlandense]KAJ5811307.1 integral membrane protein [Penicillium riverlandense]